MGKKMTSSNSTIRSNQEVTMGRRIMDMEDIREVILM